MRREQDGAWGSADTDVPAAARAALDRGVAHLLSRQTASGWWKGELETNVTMDAEDLLMREFLGIRTREETALAANWIRNKQREDGSWATYYGGPPDLSTTIEAYAALRLAGDPSEAEHMKRAREVVLGLGGIEHSRVFTRIWLALFGEWSWDELPALPPEVILLPSWFPLNSTTSLLGAPDDRAAHDRGLAQPCGCRRSAAELRVGERRGRPSALDGKGRLSGSTAR
jgi:squalene-hopene/tetraprenyl-beta-curcumene cyclase